MCVQEKPTDFINVVAWRGTADFVTRYFRKGSMIAIQGSIQTRNYEDKQGNKRTAFEIVADNVSFCGSKGESGTQNAVPSVTATNPSSSAPSFSTADSGDFEMIEGDEELPF